MMRETRRIAPLAALLSVALAATAAAQTGAPAATGAAAGNSTPAATSTTSTSTGGTGTSRGGRQATTPTFSTRTGVIVLCPPNDAIATAILSGTALSCAP